MQGQRRAKGVVAEGYRCLGKTGCSAVPGNSSNREGWKMKGGPSWG